MLRPARPTADPSDGRGFHEPPVLRAHLDGRHARQGVRGPCRTRSGGRGGDPDPARRARPPRLLRGARAAFRGGRGRRAGDRLLRADGRHGHPAGRLRLHGAPAADALGAPVGRHLCRSRSPRRGRARPFALLDRLLLRRPAVVPHRDVEAAALCRLHRVLRRAGGSAPVRQFAGPGRRGGRHDGRDPRTVRRRGPEHSRRVDRAVRRRAHGERRAARAPRLPGRAAQLLRPQGRGVRGGVRRCLAPGPVVHRGADAR